MLKEAHRYLAFVKAAESAGISTLEKRAMWNGFYDELQKISEAEAASILAHTYAKKLAYVKQAGVVTETLGGVAGAMLTEKAISKFHPSIGHGAHVAALTAGAIGGSVLADRLFNRKKEEIRPGAPGSPEYTAGKEDHSGMGLVAASWYLQRQQSGLAKAAGIPSHIAQPLLHAGIGAGIGAGVGAWRAKPGERTKGALKGGAVGAAGGLAAGHAYKRVKRGITASRMAAQEYGHASAREAMKAPNSWTINQRAQEIKGTLPIYPGKTVTSSKKEKDDPYSRVGDSAWDKHKGKIIAGLALATAAGVGAKLLHNRHKYGPTHAAPASVRTQPSPAPAAAAPAAAPRPRPKPKKQEHAPFSRGRTWEAGRERTWGTQEEY